MRTPTLKQPRRFSLVLVLALFASPTTACIDTEPGASGTGGSATMTGGAGGSAGSPTGGGSGAGPAGASGSSSSGQGGGGTSAGVGGSAPAGSSGTGASGSGGVAGTAPGGSGGSAAGSGGAAGTTGGASGAGGTAGAGGSSGGAGGAAGTSGGGSGGAAGFNPCPATGACRILPLGDSITDGFETPGGYRIELFRLASQGNKNFTFVGGSMNGPTMVDNQPFPRAHEGHSGWTIMQIDNIVPSPALGVDPHIILLHIGTNDMGSAAGAPERLATLLDQIIADSPEALLVVSSIIPFPGRASQVMTFNAAIPPLVTARANMGKHVIFVDQFTGFPNSELADGVHPNPAGYARMAGVWYRAISSYLR